VYVTLIVDGKVIDRRSVRLRGGECAAGEVDVMSWSQYEHSPTVTQQTHSLALKGHRQRISTVGYKTIFRKINTEETFLPFTVITNKDYLLNLLSRYM